VETGLDEGTGHGWRTPSEVVGVSGKRENLTAHYTFPLSGTSARSADRFDSQHPEKPARRWPSTRCAQVNRRRW